MEISVFFMKYFYAIVHSQYHKMKLWRLSGIEKHRLSDTVFQCLKTGAYSPGKGIRLISMP